MTPQPTPPGAWGIAALLFLFMVVNFADKAVVGLAGPKIIDDLGLSAAEFGRLGSAFFLLFSASAVVVGFLVNRVSSRWVILVLGAAWALVQFPMLGAVGFTTLAVCRVLLGAGEGPAAAVALHGLYKWFPDDKRTLPTALLTQGAAVGVVVAIPSLTWVINHYSWHWAFGALGIAGLLWCMIWLLLGREGRSSTRPLRLPAPSPGSPIGGCSSARPMSGAAPRSSAPIGRSRSASLGSRRFW